MAKCIFFKWLTDLEKTLVTYLMKHLDSESFYTQVYDLPVCTYDWSVDLVIASVFAELRRGILGFIRKENF